MSKYKFNEIGLFIAGQSPKSIYYSNEEGIPFAQGNRTFGDKYVKIDTYTKKVTKMAMKGDILISVRAPVGDLNIATTDMCIGRGLGAIKAINGNNEFLYYALKYNIQNLIRQGNGTTFSSITKDIINDFNLIIPSKESVQRKISSLLSAIDYKIENNNKINVELELMTKTIYDYWFLQFDFPDEDGKPYKSSGGKMVWNEELKREIPEGWEVKAIEQIESNIITGRTPSTKKQEYYNGDIPFITIGDIRGNMHIVNTEQTLSFIGADSQVNKYLPEGTICVSCIASPGLVGFTTKKSQTNQQINSIICNHTYNKMFLYFAITEYFVYSFGAKTGNTFKNMNKNDFSNIKLIYPSSSILKCFEEKTKSIYNLILKNSRENIELTSFRDFLLPLLMNGQVGFKEGIKEKEIENIVKEII